MTEQVIIIDTADKVTDADIDNAGNYIAITNKNEIITATYRHLLSPAAQYPFLVRWLPEGHFLVVDAMGKQENNTWVYNQQGELQWSFFAGDGIEDVLVFTDRLVFTYFDEGVSGDPGPNQEGLTVFSYQGRLLHGFNSAAKGLIADCYCACKLNDNTVLFYPYTGFQMIALHPDTFIWQQYETPGDFTGARSMTCHNGQAILHHTYSDKENFYYWDISENKVTRQGAFRGTLRGRANGIFLSVENNVLKIIRPLIDY